MTGYQEILTDNAYCGQIIMMTYPLIGNYGINRDDYESIDPSAFGLVVKEMRVGFCNGLFLGILAFVFIGCYIWLLKSNPITHAFVISGCVGFSLMIAMVISSMVGTLVPMFFHKIKIDPAVASGPLITTINDLVAVITYYGLAWLLLIHVLQMV